VKNIFAKKLLMAVLLSTVALATVSVSTVMAYTKGDFNSADGLRLDGSTTVYPIVKAALGVTTDGGTSTSGPFQNAGHPLQAQVLQGGSGVGKADAQGQIVDIGDASSIADIASYPNLVASKIARDGICIIVNNNVNVTDITPAQVKAIYEGTINSWSAINSSASGTIVPLARLVGSGTRDAIADFTGMDKTKEASFLGNAARYDANADEANQVVGTPNSIGYVGIGYAAALQSAGTAKILTVNGRKATAQNVTTTDSNKLYPFSRYLYLLQNNNPTDSTVVANRSNANAFIQWMSDPLGPAQAIVAQQDFLKLVPDSDINTDGTINGLDLSKLGKSWNMSVSNNRADINGDGVVNGLDLSKLGLWWNTTYGAPGALTPDYPTS
jgi:ABC-type phosphate transport system substrate-binding protein